MLRHIGFALLLGSSISSAAWAGDLTGVITAVPSSSQGPMFFSGQVTPPDPVFAQINTDAQKIADDIRTLIGHVTARAADLQKNPGPDLAASYRSFAALCSREHSLIQALAEARPSYPGMFNETFTVYVAPDVCGETVY